MKNLTIGSTKIKVIMDKKLGDKTGVVAQYHVGKNEIHMQTGLTPDNHTSNLIHEAMHAIFHEYSIYKCFDLKAPMTEYEQHLFFFMEELFVTNISNAICSMLRTNPELVKLIAKTYK